MFAARAEKKSVAPPAAPMPGGGPGALAMLNRAEEQAGRALREREHAKGAAQLRDYFNRPEMQRRFGEAQNLDAGLSLKEAGKASPGAPASAGQGGGHVLGEAKGFFQREYLHKARSGADFQDTLLWHPSLYADKGTAQVTFDLAGQETTYRVLLLGHTANGRFGFLEDRLKVQVLPKTK